MTLEEEYFKKSLNAKPFDSGTSLHVEHYFYKIDDKIVRVYYAIGETEPLVEVQDYEEYVKQETFLAEFFKRKPNIA
jgi:hypothetical protein